MNHGTVTRMINIVQRAKGRHNLCSKVTGLHRLESPKRHVRLLHSERFENQKYRAGVLRNAAQETQSKNPPNHEDARTVQPKRDIHRRHLESFGKIHELQHRLGLVNIERPLQRPTVFVSIDTETERLGLLDYVSEVGICILDTRNLVGMPPGPNAKSWCTKMQTVHWRIDHNNLVIKKRVRADHCLFCKSKNLTPKKAQDALLRHLYAIKSTDTDPVDIVLVGHTITHDMQALKGRPLFLNLRQSVNLAQVFDTIALAAEAEEEGATFDTRSLGFLLPKLGVDSKYLRLFKGSTTLRGWHNSGNDAAYTMMLLVQFALRWHDLVEGKLSPQECGSSVSGAAGEEV